MKFGLNKQGNSCVTVVMDEEFMLCDVQSALDLIANANYLYESSKILIRKENICEDFFDLKTGIAGEILQKAVNYGACLAIVGDFSGYTSKSLRDFIFESNKTGKHVLFLENEAEALARLHGMDGQ